MSRDDLLADLRTEAGNRPAAPPTPPRAIQGTGGGTPTPAFEMSVTPLRWSLPAVGPVPQGFGLAVRLGPVQLSVAVR